MRAFTVASSSADTGWARSSASTRAVSSSARARFAEGRVSEALKRPGSLGVYAEAWTSLTRLSLRFTSTASRDASPWPASIASTSSAGTSG